MLPGREEKGGGKRSKQSWRKDCELYCTLWIGYKSWLQELLKWRNSYLLTLRSNLQSPSVSAMIYVTQSRQDWAQHNETDAHRNFSRFEMGSKPQFSGCVHGHEAVPKEGLRSGSRCVLEKAGGGCCFPMTSACWWAPEGAVARLFSLRDALTRSRQQRKG